VNDSDTRQAQELEQERAMELLSALDECWKKNVSVHSLRILVFETGAGSLLNNFGRKTDG